MANKHKPQEDSKKNPERISKKKRRPESPAAEGNEINEQDVPPATNEKEAGQPSKKTHGNCERKGMHSLITSLGLSESVKYVIEHGFEKSPKEKIEKTLDEIIPHLIDRMTDPKEETNSSVITILSFLKTLSSWTDYGKRHMVQRMFVYFSTSISAQGIDSVWRSHMVQLITKFVQTTHFNEHSKFGLLLLGYLFSVALHSGDKPVTTADIKRIKELKMFILQVDLLDPTMNDILAYFMTALVSKDFLKHRDGMLVLAHFLSKEASLVRTIQAKIRDNLSSFTRKLAANYGIVYFHAWILTEEGSLVRKEIEQRCIQDIMLRAMSLKRNGTQMGPIGCLTFGILQVLAANRRLTKFSQLMTELYQPILWRSLKSDNPIVRCNAAQIFLDVFPLEKVGQGATANCEFKDMQVKEIKDLLLDECHLVRVIAVRGLASVLIQSNAVLSIADIRELVSILTDKLVHDAAHLVPAAVFATMESIIEPPALRQIALPILKNMNKCLFDINERVRKSFVKVLLRLKELNDPEALFWEVVPFKHILLKLEEEQHQVVGEMLVQLIFSNIYTEGQPIVKTMSNLIRIIRISAVALMKIFKFGSKEVKVMDAYNILVTIVGVINKKIKEKMSEITKEAENVGTADNTTNRRKKSSRTLQNITNKNVSEDEDGSSSDSSVEQPPPSDKQDILDDHKVMSGLLNAAAMLWAKYNNELREMGNYDTINLIATPAVPLLLRYYKGTEVYYTVVSFASLIPIQLLAPHSTITGACIAELREMDESSDFEHVKCLALALCFWNRGHDIVELALDWLNESFRHENLNNTLQPRSNKKKTRVRFRPTQGKPLMGLKLLELLFGHGACEPKLVLKNYDQLYDTFLFLERIKELIERRLENGEEFKQPDLSDVFLEKCLNVYLTMVIMLHRPDDPPAAMSESNTRLEPFSANSTSTEMLNWSHRVFVPHLKEETESQFIFALKCFHLVLKSSVLAIDLSFTDKMHSLALCLLVTKLTETGSPLQFLEINFEVIRSLCYYNQAYNAKDEWEVFSKFVPELLQQNLDVVTSIEITAEKLSSMMENFKKFKLNFFHPLKIYRQVYGVQHVSFQNLCNMYLTVCVELIAQAVLKTDELDVYMKFDDHPFFVSLIMKYFLSSSPLKKLILPWLQAHVIHNKEDPAEIIASISLLSTLLLSFKSKFEIDHLELAISKCYEVLMALENVDDVKIRGEEVLLDVCKASGCALKTSN